MHLGATSEVVAIPGGIGSLAVGDLRNPRERVPLFALRACVLLCYYYTTTVCYRHAFVIFHGFPARRFILPILLLLWMDPFWHFFF